MLGSRPDLAFSINELAQYSANPTQRHWQGIKRILHFVKATANAKLVLGRRHTSDVTVASNGSPESYNLVEGYFDAAYMDDTNDRHSTMGYMFFVAGSPVSWMSKKQRVVALSTTEAEYLAGTEATKEAVWIQTFLQAIVIPCERITLMHLYGDNQSANALAKNPEYHVRTKHIHGKQRYITEMVEQVVINVTYIPTTSMIADTLTKPLPRVRYEAHMRLMGVWCITDKPEDKRCWTCAILCESKNELYRHLKTLGHHRVRKDMERRGTEEVKNVDCEGAGEAKNAREVKSAGEVKVAEETKDAGEVKDTGEVKDAGEVKGVGENAGVSLRTHD